MGLNLSGAEPQYGVELGSTHNFMLWCPTARTRGGQVNGLKTVRSSDEVYWKGISEKMHLETTTSDPWIWRRVVFTIRDSFPQTEVNINNYVTESVQMVPIAGPSGQIPAAQQAGVIRGVTNYYRTLESLPVPQYELLAERVFQGVRGADWFDYSTAKTDKTQINVLSDRTRRLTSGNDSAQLKTSRQWIPLNKRMVYPNQEWGAVEGNFNDRFAAGTTHGNMLHDVYIMDYFQQPIAAPGAIIVQAETSLHWHER